MSLFSSLFGSTRITPKKEMGVSNARIVHGYIQDNEKNVKLKDGTKAKTYQELVANHAVIGASIRAFTDLASSATWSVETEDDSPESKASEEFAERLLTEVDTSWARFHRQAATFKYNGVSILEWTMKRSEEDGRLVFGKIEPRRNETIERWDIDDDGKLIGVEQVGPITGESFYIPRKKLVYFVDDALTDQPDGLGLLRHCFREADRLEQFEILESIAFDRDARGILVGRGPFAALQQAVADDKITEAQATASIKALEDIVKMQRKLPNTGLTLDSATYESRSETGIAVTGNRQWDIEILQGQQPGLVELAAAIKAAKLDIARVLGTEFMMLGSDGTGSLALSKTKTNSFLKSVNSTNVDIVERSNKDLLDVAWKMNGLDEKTKPKWTVSDIQEKDIEQVAAVLRDMASAGAVLAPDDDIIDEIRQDMGYSPQTIPLDVTFDEEV